MKSVKQLNVYRWCLDCGYERFDKEDVHIDDKDRKVSEGFIMCPRCKGGRFALGGYRDRRRSVVLTGGEDEIELGVESRIRSERYWKSMVCKKKEVSMKENKSDVTDAVPHWIAVIVAACAILLGCGRSDSSEFEITLPREWDEGISRSRYVVSEDTGKTVLVTDNSLLRGERLPTIKEALKKMGK